MIYKLITVLLLFNFSVGMAQEDAFSKESLTDTFITLKGEKVTFGTILENNKGNNVLLDIWATWCRDCIIGMPAVKKLAVEYPDITIVYLSLDKTEKSWKKGIKRFNMGEGQHYWASNGWESNFFDSIDLDWIPRYMIIDKNGKIKLFKAIKASDKRIVQQLITLRNEK